MRTFTTEELSRMRDTQETAMQDLGYIRDYSPTTEYGEPIPDWTERTSPTPIGVNMKSSTEVSNDAMDRLEIDGTIRLPLGCGIDENAQIRIVQRFGENITPLVVAVVGVPQEGPSGLKVDFKKVVPGQNP